MDWLSSNWRTLLNLCKNLISNSPSTSKTVYSLIALAPDCATPSYMYAACNPQLKKVSLCVCVTTKEKESVTDA